MPDFLANLLTFEGLVLISIGALLAGLVRGFAGFGTAMIFLPIAAQVLGPFEALTVMLVKDMIAPLYHVPRALKDGHPADVGRLGLGLLLAMPLGVWALTLVPAEVFRYGVSSTALLLVVLLLAGVRYRGELKTWMIYGTGALGGLLGGSVGVPGPPVIMLYMASTHPAKVIRANNTLYLILADVVMVGSLWGFGKLQPAALGLGLVMVVPYLIGNVAGAAIFRPGAEKIYRAAAYAIIAMSALYGLPIWD